mmetsp:Transcript_28796/g.44231  ORF Transcript_28796/g.44231 Transcript_28796/m.44231 type:complete len:264 (-) Transcript_28796:120-911(-)
MVFCSYPYIISGKKRRPEKTNDKYFLLFPNEQKAPWKLYPTTPEPNERQKQRLSSPMINDPLCQTWRNLLGANNTVINTTFFNLLVAWILGHIISLDGDITRGWTAGEWLYRIPLDNWQSYSDVLEHCPLPTKVVTSATVCFGVGDLIAQHTEDVSREQSNRLSLLRSCVLLVMDHCLMSGTTFPRISSKMSCTGRRGGLFFQTWCWIRQHVDPFGTIHVFLCWDVIGEWQKLEKDMRRHGVLDDTTDYFEIETMGHGSLRYL